MNRMSGRPSPSASNAATPEPMVSGSHFLPVRPALWVKWIPDAAVTSAKRSGVCAASVPASSSSSACLMLMNRLPLVIVFRVRQTWLFGERLRGFVRLESSEQNLLAGGLLLLTHAPVAE